MPSSNVTDSPQSKASFPLFNKWIIGILSLVLFSGGCYLVYRQLVIPQVQTLQKPVPISAKRTNLTVTISANGTVEPEQQVNISSKTAGILTELLVKEGDYVTKGQALAKMDDSDLQGQLIEAQGKLAAAEANLNQLIAGNRPQEIAQAQARLEELEANLRKLIAGNRSQEIAQAQARLNSAQANFQQAQDDYERNSILYNEGAIALHTLNEKLAIRDSALASVTEAQEELSLFTEGARLEEIDAARAEVKSQQELVNLLQEGTRQEEIDAARGSVTSAQGVLKTIQTQIEDTVVRAPFSGIVLSKYADPGAFVTPMTSGSSVSSATSSSILSLASQNEVVANVAETSIAKIRIGQDVNIEADAYPGQVFQGRVSQIAHQATVEQNVTSFEVKVSLQGDSAQQLLAGMNVSLKFKVDELQNVLTVPSIAITREDNETGVFVVAPNQEPKFIPITTGVTVDNRTEVKSGLDGTEHILVNAPSSSGPPPQSGFSWRSLFGGSAGPPGDGPPGGGPPGGGPPGGGPP